jgi:carboxylesterase
MTQRGILLALIHGAEPFLLPGGKRGVLLVHGFTGSPAQMRLLGDYLQARGYTVFGPRLCGHGTTVEEMAETGWRHWYSAVEDGYHILKALCDDVAVAGLSMGALLAFNLAAEYPVRKVASLSAPVFIADRRMPLLPVYRMFRKYVPQKRRKVDVDPIYDIYYELAPLSALDSLVKLISHVDALLPGVDTPALVIQSRNEHTVRSESAEHIYGRLGSRAKELVWLEKSGHLITLDMERDQVFAQVADFFDDAQKEG